MHSLSRMLLNHDGFHVFFGASSAAAAAVVGCTGALPEMSGTAWRGDAEGPALTAAAAAEIGSKLLLLLLLWLVPVADCCMLSATRCVDTSKSEKLPHVLIQLVARGNTVSGSTMLRTTAADARLAEFPPTAALQVFVPIRALSTMNSEHKCAFEQPATGRLPV